MAKDKGNTLLGRGFITLLNVNESYLVLLTTPSVSISASHDGSDPDLSNARTEVRVQRGKKHIDFDIVSITPSNSKIQSSVEKISSSQYTVRIVSLPLNVMSGFLRINIKTFDGYVTFINFNFSVIRDIRDIEWIEQWNGTATELGEDYVVTPKLFAGEKKDGKLTGIYLGERTSMPSDSDYPFQGETFKGIYGYQNNKISFGIDGNGAFIGGWIIQPKAIQNKAGTLTIHSDGYISSQHNGLTHWSINEDGSAFFACKKVQFKADGSASFEGTVIAKSGSIASWNISDNAIYNDSISINSNKRFIAVSNIQSDNSLGDSQLDLVKTSGGVAMHHTSHDDYGFICYNGSDLIFSAGSLNKIACWTFTKQSLFSGKENNVLREYTEDGITIGGNGIRGLSWYIDTDGVASFAKGAVTFDSLGGRISSWSIDHDSIFIGTKGNIEHTFTNEGSVTIGSAGLRGHNWRLESDGSGGIAGDKIKWDIYGNVQFDKSIRLMWDTGISIANMVAFGQMLHRDPEFTKEGFNDSEIYLPHGTTRIKTGDRNAPNSSKTVMSITNTRWNAENDLRIGGFYFNDKSRPNAKFLVRIVAKIPIHWHIQNTNENYGDSGTTQWLTNTGGTGKYEEYICLVTCGSENQYRSFSTVNNFSLKYSDNDEFEVAPVRPGLQIVLRDKTWQRDVIVNEVNWKVAYATTIDATSSEKMTTTIDANGIYTGTLTANQVNALACTFDKGTIGGWSIAPDSIFKGNVILGADGSIFSNFWRLGADGSGFLAGQAIKWDANGQAEFVGKVSAGSGEIGGIKLSDDHIGVLPKAKDRLSTDDNSLSIYKDYFQVGGKDGYFQTGNNIIPDWSRGYTAITARIVNHIPNNDQWMGVDTINVGMVMHVSGAQKNYGIYSDAPLRAPGFVATKACLLNLVQGEYKADFSLYNVFLLYTPTEWGIEFELPSEKLVARQFGIISGVLPDDFAIVITFLVRRGSRMIKVMNVYDQNDKPQNYKMSPGDSMMILLSKIDGFKYSILHYNA